MNFSDEKYRKGLESLMHHDITCNHHWVDAFFQLIEGVEANTLNLLITRIHDYFERVLRMGIGEDEVYQLLQNKMLSNDMKREILGICYQCLDSGVPLGESYNNWGYNLSGWIAHSLEEARLCADIASMCGLDPVRSFRLGLLHDYGRKYDHGFMHPIIGFERLYDLKYYDEAIGCLTHSFLNGNFFACYCPSSDYIVDQNLKAVPVSGERVNHDLYHFLKAYTYSDYDRILNVADLMATANGVVSPKDRILEIEKRRKMEGLQREFFLKQLLETLAWCLTRIGVSYAHKGEMTFDDASTMTYEVVKQYQLRKRYHIK